MKTFLTLGFLALFAGYGACVPSAASTSTSSIEWGNCTASDPPSLDCGKLKVPLDWNEPNGPQITLVMARVKATNPDKRIGNLVFNPGGPGASATRVCQVQAAGYPIFSQGLLESFDLICPDPRGVGLSNPIQCDPDIWNERVSNLPTNEESFKRMVDHNKDLGASCLNLTGPLLYHVDTKSAAKDVEAIRIALNDGKLNWLGISYGSLLGSIYAELYPENIHAMALDGILDHSQSRVSFAATEAVTYENSLDRFFEWCNQNVTCAVHGPDTAKFFDNLVIQANKSPIPAPGCVQSQRCRTNVTGEEILYNTQELILSRDPSILGGGWPGLGIALNESSAGNATLLSTALALPGDPTPYANLAIGCLDFAHHNDSSNTSYIANKQRQLLTSQFLAPHTKGECQSYYYETQCVGWPAPLANPPHRLNQTAIHRLQVPILLVNADHDPSTSYLWANEVQDQIPKSVLLTRQGDGHTSYFLHGETTRAIEAYLINGTLPAPGTLLDS